MAQKNERTCAKFQFGWHLNAGHNVDGAMAKPCIVTTDYAVNVSEGSKPKPLPSLVPG